jgi:hypothetical protein
VPAVGKLEAAAGSRPAEGPDGRPDGAVELDGETGRLVYLVDEFPGEEYTVAFRARIHHFPQGRLGQLFSAWTAPGDDPLRLVIDRGRLFARIEAAQGYSSEGVAVEPGRWYHVAAVKDGASLTLYLDGKPVAQGLVAHTIRSQSRAVALGANPRYTGNECLAARFADFRLEPRPLAPEEIAALSSGPAR